MTKSARALGRRLAQRDCSPGLGKYYVFFQIDCGVTTIAELVGEGQEAHDAFVGGYVSGLTLYGAPDVSLF